MFKIYIILTGVISIIEAKYWKNDPTLVAYHLSNDKYDHLLLNESNLNTINNDYNTYFYTCGWFTSWSSDRVDTIRAKLLKSNSTNFIAVDWDELSHQLPRNSAQDSCDIGKNVGEFIADLIDVYGLNWNRIEMVGHSMGAHISGNAGRRVNELLALKINRIYGLDPGGPTYDTVAECELTASDAKFVQTIQTNRGFYGMDAFLGKANFVANCGVYQDGCSTLAEQDTSAFTFCSHFRSVDYFIEAISSNQFIGGKESNESNVEGCLELAVFGIHGDDNAEGVYYFSTNSESPYAKGLTGACEDCRTI